MKPQNWWGVLAYTRYRLDLLLQACAPALIARSIHDEAGARRDASRLTMALDAATRIAEDILRRSRQ